MNATAIDYINTETLKPRKDGLDHIPGEKGWPVIGKTLDFVKDASGLLQSLREKYNSPVVKVCLAGNWIVVVTGPDAIEMILMDRERAFSAKFGNGLPMGVMFKRGLMLRDFEDHKMHRKTMQPAFRSDAMKYYAQQMNSFAAEQIPHWGDDGDVIKFYSTIKQFTLDFGALVFVGVPLGEDSDKLNSAFVDTVLATVAPVKKGIPFTSYKRGLDGRKYLEEYFYQLLGEKRNSTEQDMFSQYAQATNDKGERFTDDEVIDHMIFLLMAAHDTITSSITTMVKALATHTDWQEKVRQELLALGTETLQFDDLSNLPITDQVFFEALRLYSPVPYLNRRTIKEVEIDGVKIPENTQIMLDAHHTHHMSQWWDNPEQFDPDRFGAERNEQGRHKFSWVPFGGGVHKCLGLHFAQHLARVFLFHFLSNYRFELADPSVDEPIAQVPMPRPVNRLPLRLTRI